MSSDISRFAHCGEYWSDRASLGELDSVLYAGGPERVNLMLHAATLVGAKVALGLNGYKGHNKRALLDFGCGTGRMLRFFSSRGWRVIGTEISDEMLFGARKFGVSEGSALCLTNGVSIPLRDCSVDMVWVCGVLKYTLFEPDSACRGGIGPDKVANTGSGSFVPAYADIAKEMYRVLNPGGVVVNLEMWVDAPPDVFVPDFEQAGFVTKQVRVLRRYLGRPETLVEQWRPWHRFPPQSILTAGKLIATLRCWLDNPRRRGGGLRDYLFVWTKPTA